MKHYVTSFLDYFYPPFRRLMPRQTFRYALCGGFNTLLGLTVYYIFVYHIFKNEVFDFGFYAFEPHTASLIVSSTTSFITGFLLNKYVVFVESLLKGHVQLFRYFLAFIFNLILNWAMLKYLVEKLHWEPFVAQVLTTIVVIAFGYIAQRHFSFRVVRDK